MNNDNILLTEEQLGFFVSLQPGVLVMVFVFCPEEGEKQYDLLVIEPKDLPGDETIEKTTVADLFLKIKKIYEGDLDLDSYFEIV